MFSASILIVLGLVMMLMESLLASLALLFSGFEGDSVVTNTTKNIGFDYYYMLYVIVALALGIFIITSVYQIKKNPYYSILAFFGSAASLLIFGMNKLSKLDDGFEILSGVNATPQMIYEFIFAPAAFLFIAGVLSVIKERLTLEEDL